MVSSRWNKIYIVAALIMGSILLGLILAVPRNSSGIDWYGQYIPGAWMAWSFPIAFFFWVIASLLVILSLLAIRFPEMPRVGIFGIETTRGDRLFISLLGSAFINLAWLGLVSSLPQWGALIVCLVYAAAVFRWV
jgi:predicted small integral membrane protein